MPASPDRRWKPKLALAVLVALGAIAGGCSPGDQGGALQPTTTTSAAPVPPPRTGGVLRMGVSSEIRNLNPALAAWTESERQVALASLETLVSYSAAGVPVPDVASSLVPDADGSTWRLTLREGVALTSGRPVDAVLVAEVLGIMRSSGPSVSALTNLTGIEVAGELELVLRTAEVWAELPHALATQAGVVADPAWLRSADPWRPVGTGPFILTSPGPDGTIEGERNPGYWRSSSEGVELPYLDGVRAEVVTDAGARAARIEAGRLDLAVIDDPAEVERLGSASGDGSVVVVVGQPGSGVNTGAQLNLARPPFDSSVALRAVLLATDPDDVASEVLEDVPEELSGPGRDVRSSAASTTTTSTTVLRGTDDPATLVELIEDASGATPSIELLVATDPTDLAAAVELHDQWSDVGFDVELHLVGAAELAARVAAGDYEAAVVREQAWRAERATAPASPAPSELVWLFHTTVAAVASNDLRGLTAASTSGGPGMGLFGSAQPLWPLWFAREEGGSSS